jgi:hypothetical protein
MICSAFIGNHVDVQAEMHGTQNIKNISVSTEFIRFNMLTVLNKALILWDHLKGNKFLSS